MRIAFARPNRAAAWDKMAWAARAAVERGHEIQDAHDLESLRRADEWAELVILEQYTAGMNQCDLITAAQQRKAVWFSWHWDLIQRHPDEAWGDTAAIRDFASFWRSVDCVLTKECRAFSGLQGHGISSAYVDQACPDWWPMVDRSREPEFDAMIVGNTTYERRKAAARRMVDLGLKVAWIGQAQTGRPIEGVTYFPPIEPAKLPEALSRAAVALSIDFRPAPGYTSDRLYLLAGAGACTIDSGPTPRAGQITVLESEIAETAAALARNPAAARNHGTRAREWVLTHKTYGHRIDEIVKLAEFYIAKRRSR